MSDKKGIVENLTTGQTWLRGIFMLLFVLIYSVTEVIVFVVVLLQFLFFELYLILLSVLNLIQFGTCLFCLVFLPSFAFILVVLFEPIRYNNINYIFSLY